ncbi:MAG: phosphatase PAP2 family protein [Ignavibacteriaceae bacterium]
MKSITIALLLTIICFFNNYAQRKLNPFSNIGSNSVKSFSGLNLVLHGAGILSTYALIHTGTDNQVHNYFAENGYSSFFDPAVGMGYLVPVILGGGIYLYGETQNSSKEKAAGSAVIQAVLISAVYSSLLKAVTGRPNPSPEIYADEEASKEFLFGFLRGGIHYGWPSGHLCTNTAMVSSLIFFYKENTAIKIAGLLYLSYLFYGVTVHDNNTMHWFSDIVSGLLMGYAIGSTTGKNFRDEWDKTNFSSPGATANVSPGLVRFTLDGNDNLLTVSPVINNDYKGINLNLSF